METIPEKIFYVILLVFFWVFFLLPLYPEILLIALIGKWMGVNDWTFWSFTKEWFLFGILRW